MMDFVKVVLEGVNPIQLMRHPLLDFKGVINIATGEISEGKEATFQGLKFKIFRSRVVLEGSLHYYWNKGLHNYNDFTGDDLKRVLNELSEKFHFDLSKARLENLEPGVNFEVPFKVSKLLSNLIYHKMKRFQDVEVGRGYCLVANHERYRIKIYDKGSQFCLPEQVMRVELHYSRMIDVAGLGVTHLSDLLDSHKLRLLGDCVLKEWNDIFLFDWTMKPNNLTKRENREYYRWRQADYWLELDKNNRNKKRTAYDKLVTQHSSKIKAQVAELIENKVSEMIIQNGDLLTEGANQKKATN